MNRRVLVVEDDEPIGRAVVDALTAHGYTIELCADGAVRHERVGERCSGPRTPRAGLPDVDGFTLCRQIRESHPDLPIVLVTARDSEIDIVVGLDAGANDYVTKPFSMNMLARPHSRAPAYGGSTRSGCGDRGGSLRVEPASYVASVDGKPVDLRPREFQLLVVLSRAAGRVVTRERLLADVWDLHWESSTKTLDMHVPRVASQARRRDRDRHGERRRLPAGRPVRRRITEAIVGVTALVLLVLGCRWRSPCTARSWRQKSSSCRPTRLVRSRRSTFHSILPTRRRQPRTRRPAAFSVYGLDGNRIFGEGPRLRMRRCAAHWPACRRPTTGSEIMVATPISDHSNEHVVGALRLTESLAETNHRSRVAWFVMATSRSLPWRWRGWSGAGLPAACRSR